MADLIDTTSRVVIIRHLPADLSTEEKEDFLKHFGAKCVKCMGTTGRMKHTAFATFPSEEEACKAIKRLHQLEILGHKLVVEYAKQQHQEFVPSESEYKRLDPLKDTKVSEVEKKKKKKRDTVDDSLTELQKKLDAVAPHLGLTYAASARLRYRYPQPNVTILTNIANALASVPRFYTQVLHLMNKMNLPAPFSVITATPDVPLGQEVFEGRQEAEDMELGSSPESSELESEGERRDKPDRVVPILQKRPARRKARPIAKRPRLQQLIKMPEAPPSGHVSKPEEVFELPTGQTAKKLEIRISSETDAANSMFDDTPSVSIPVVEGGFGQFAPPDVQGAAVDETEKEEPITDFISRSELQKGRLPRHDMKNISVYKNYEPGEPTNRLYLKNLAKQVEEKDLRYIFGRYVENTEEATNLFDIRLMKEGRMKGQAFITLSNDENAKEALGDTNGYVLFDKPLVVVFARSARPKDDPKQKTTKLK